jgi:hypothetical protein
MATALILTNNSHFKFIIVPTKPYSVIWNHKTIKQNKTLEVLLKSLFYWPTLVGHVSCLIISWYAVFGCSLLEACFIVTGTRRGVDLWARRGGGKLGKVGRGVTDWDVLYERGSYFPLISFFVVVN